MAMTPYWLQLKQKLCYSVTHVIKPNPIPKYLSRLISYQSLFCALKSCNTQLLKCPHTASMKALGLAGHRTLPYAQSTFSACFILKNVLMVFGPSSGIILSEYDPWAITAPWYPLLTSSVVLTIVLFHQQILWSRCCVPRTVLAPRMHQLTKQTVLTSCN